MKPPPVQTNMIPLGDVEGFVVRVGAGRPVLVCGGLQLGHTYMRTLDYLADANELIYYDARGSGQTALGDPSELTFAQAVADLEALRAGLGIERFVVLGHSLGGQLGYLYASRYPDRVEALVLVDVGPPLDAAQARELGRAMRALRTPEDEAQLARLQASPELERRDPKTVEQLILNIYTPFFRDRHTIGTVKFGFTDITAANVLDYEERMVASLPQEDPRSRLAMVRCPTLVMHGEIDPVPAAFGQQLADAIPNAQFALIPGASHFPFIEDTEQFERTLRPFLAAIA